MSKKGKIIVLMIIIVSAFIIVPIVWYLFKIKNENPNTNCDMIQISLPVYNISEILSFGSRWGTLIDFGGEIGWQPHQGIDLNLANNTYVIAGINATVGGVWIGICGNKYQVNLKIDNCWEITHIFEPIENMTIEEMEKCVFVSKNEKVVKGQVIGVLRGGGGHIHWDVMKRNFSVSYEDYYRTNPAFYLSNEDYIALNKHYHKQIFGPDTKDRIYDLVMFNNPIDWKVPKLYNLFENLTNISSIRPFGVPNPKNESSSTEFIHEDLDFNITGKTEVLIPYSGNCSSIFVNASSNLLRIDFMLNPSFWIRFELITSQPFNSTELLGFLNESIAVGKSMIQNQTIITTPSSGSILHFGLARYNHTTGYTDPANYSWDNPSWFFDGDTLNEINNCYQTHDLEDWHSQGFFNIY